MKVSKQGPQSGERGTVLLLVLMLVSILVVIAVESFRFMQVEISSTYLFSRSLKSGSVCRTALSSALALLAKDGEDNEFDHLKEIWSNPKEQKEIRLPELKKRDIELQIMDEGRKLPVNYLACSLHDKDGSSEKQANCQKYQEILKRLLTHKPFSLESQKAEELIKALVDWVDEKKGEEKAFEEQEQEEVKTFSEKENATVQEKDAPMSFISELMLVEGMSENLYYGQDDLPGLRDLLTVYSDQGKVNINTASPLLLQAMVPSIVHWETAAEFAKSMQDFRKDPMHWDFLKNTDWYKDKMPGYNDIQLPESLLTTKSKYFAVQVKASLSGVDRGLFAYVRRGVKKEDQDKDEKGPGIEVIYQEYY